MKMYEFPIIQKYFVIDNFEIQTNHVLQAGLLLNLCLLMPQYLKQWQLQIYRWKTAEFLQG